MTEPGIYRDVPQEEYQAIRGWNSTALKRMYHSPKAARYGLAEVESLAQKGGVCTHKAVLQPSVFERECVVMPRFHGGMKEETAIAAGYAGGKAARDEWLHRYGYIMIDGKLMAVDERSATVEIVEGPVRDEALGIRDAVHGCGPAHALLCGDGGVSEVTLVWDDPLGVRCKARLDRLMPNRMGGWTVADLKKTTSTRAEAFAAEVARWRMHVQACFYLRGARILKGAGPADAVFGDGWAFCWVAFESRPPHLPGVFQMDGPMREVGEREVERLLKVAAWCESTDQWPDGADKVRTIGLRPFYDEYSLPEDYTDVEPEA